MSRTSLDRKRRRLIPALAALWSASALPVAADEDHEPAANRAANAERAPVCDTPIKLGATFYLHATPDQSLAMLRTPKGQVAGLYRRGMYVEGFEVIVVEPRGVLLARGDAYCWIRLQPDPSRPQPAPPPRPSKPARKR